MEAKYSTESSVDFQKTGMCYIEEDRNLNNHLYESQFLLINVTSHLYYGLLTEFFPLDFSTKFPYLKLKFSILN
jgi:hypothetical protein